MDEIDLKLVRLLWEDPRRSYRDLSDSLGISTPAVHRRIQAARDAEILIGPYARINPCYLESVNVTLFGRTEAGSLEEAIKDLEKGDSTDLVTWMTGNVLLLRSILRDIDELDKYVDFVRKASQIPEPEICICPNKKQDLDKFKDVKVTKLDLKIMNALYKDGRMNVNDIADQIHVSSKTVRNHLKKLQDDNVLIFEIIANQAQSGNFVPMLQIYLDKNADKKKVIMDLKSHHSPPLLMTQGFSNQIGMILAYGWLQNMAQLKDLVSGVRAEEGVRTVIPHLFVNSAKLDTWLDRLLEDPEKALLFLQERKIIGTGSPWMG